MDNASESSRSSPDAAALQALPRKGTRTDRPCDVCRRRKSRCAKEPDQDRCVLCTFHDRECTYLDAPQPRKKRAEFADDRAISVDGHGDSDPRPPLKKTKATQTPDDGTLGPPIASSSVRSLLDRTLGLHRTTHFKYIGPSSLHEERLLDLIHRFYESGNGEDGCKFRRVADATTFLSKSDRHTLFSADVDHDLDTVEQIVQPHGPGLVDLYFRTVHPSYPILHKGVFIEKYARSYKEFSPPLLAAVYLLAMDWWEFDLELASKQKPDAEALLRTAMKALTGVIHRPKLSSVQAGLLLLQRAGGDSWVLTTQVVGIGEELGLHLDCTPWNIPEWEKGLRRRLAWAIYMQDKWGALIHGRPSHVTASNWQMAHVSLADFPESAADEDDKEGSTEVEKGRLLFIHLTKLTEIMAQATEILYSPDQTRIHELVSRSGVQGLLELVKPLAVRLKEWAKDMPADLHMEGVRTRKLCSNGYLHLSYFVTEIIIHRHIIRNLTPATPPHLRDLCREAGKARLERAINFVEALRPEHLQAFWWFASPKSLAFIRTYGGLLWATSSSHEEAEFYRRKLGDFRWSLKVRAKGVSFVAVALQEMDESLQDIDMTQSPVGRTAEASRPEAVLLSSAVPPAADAETQTSDLQIALHDLYHSHQFDSGHTSPGFNILDLDAVSSHGYFSDVGDQGVFYP
ncbi:fungal-specific transcription factor domain-containing protein [Lasiosphaeria miniovina]|uniref:Fungal-specific transcription factor domain-containing protein n=1 Tax=Lasiosphaeria miniovina TaxID=1954250 RepID=A0AA40DT27_9PEZI|nr:fungal-specific transcription factor domain-containing protein [Lasiosphaeria miniovina]KAK0712416.1 fungal-specific transcription factor domain-containing protein [Lasiosphaeria miniovina]